jgi:hypothetical protein
MKSGTNVVDLKGYALSSMRAIGQSASSMIVDLDVNNQRRS